MKGIIALNGLVIPRKDFMNVRGMLDVTISTEEYFDSIAKKRESESDAIRRFGIYCSFYARATDEGIVNIRMKEGYCGSLMIFRDYIQSCSMGYDVWENLCKFVEDNDYIMTVTKIV